MQPDGWNRDSRGNLRETWPVPDIDVVGARFRHARVRAGLSQRRLAELAGVSQSAISRLERGKSGGMPTDRLIRIAISMPHFPFGHCPHTHECGYPFDPRPQYEVHVGSNARRPPQPPNRPTPPDR
jgi:DNA-binding XRE family transcriptional regulator